MKTVKTLKYLGSLFDANGGAEKGVNNRVNIASVIKVEGNYTGLICDKNIPKKVKRQSVQDGYKTGHGVWSGMSGS